MHIDLNADLGEGLGQWKLGDDEALLDIVTSANIACGFHAGDPGTMRRVCEMAVVRGVEIGAHVSFRDLVGFGRRDMVMSQDELAHDVLYQLSALARFARAAGGAVSYVKPHGALYNRCVHDADASEAVIAGIRAYDPSLLVLGLPGSALCAAAGDKAVHEAFADRAYQPDGSLVPRTEPGAVLTAEADVVAQAVALAATGAASICVHGDTPGAVELAHKVREGLEVEGHTLAPFACR